MKFFPTGPLALVLAAGMAGAAAAQTPATPDPGTPMKPQTTAPDTRTNPGSQLRPSFGQAQTPTNDRVRQAQAQLHSLGLYNGPTDGLMDPDTRAAIARFQQQNGIRQTSQLDQTTLDRLMGNRTTGSGSSAAGAPSMTPSTTPGAATPAPTGAGGNATGPTINR